MTIKTTHAGHGGIDPGAVRNGYKEADVARLYNAKILQLTGAVNATDDSAVSVPDNLAKIVAKVNAVSGNDDWNISIHLNAATPAATGVEVYAYSQDAAGMAKAAEISAKLATVYGIQNRGAKAGDELYVIKNTTGHMLLIELGFISNANDLNQILSKTDQACSAIVTSFGYEGIIPPKPLVPVLKIINLWDYTGKNWLPEIQQSYAGVVALDRVFGVKSGTTWRARMFHVNYEQAVVICDQLRLVYPNYEIYGARINENDPIVPTTPFSVEVDGVPQAEIDNVIRHMRTSYAGIITDDRIFLTPQPGTNPAQVTLEIHNFEESQRETIKQQLKERYGISDSQFQ